MAALLVAFLADTTLERGHVCVRSHVLLQVDRLAERLRAYDAAIWLHFSVNPEVLVQSGLLGEGLRAVIAWVGTVTRMHPHVLHEATLLSESFMTYVTFKRLQFHVPYSGVSYIFVLIVEAFAACLTVERKLYSIDRHWFLADLTANSFPPLSVLVSVVQRVFAT